MFAASTAIINRTPIDPVPPFHILLSVVLKKARFARRDSNSAPNFFWRCQKRFLFANLGSSEVCYSEHNLTVSSAIFPSCKMFFIAGDVVCSLIASVQLYRSHVLPIDFSVFSDRFPNLFRLEVLDAGG